MTRFLLPILFVIFVISKSNAQGMAVKNNASEEYIKHAISFLMDVKKTELSDSSFTLSNVPKYACFAYTVDDSVNFTKAEMNQIANEITYPKVSSWKTILPPNIRILEEKLINSVSKSIKNPKRETKLFMKKFGGCYHNFSAPIFLRDYTYCLLYVDTICAAGKSSGELQVFEKIEGVWKQKTSRCEWTE
jgi:hypothetical protein